MAATVWLTRRTQLNGGRLGLVKIDDGLAAELITKGDALPVDRNLRRDLAAFRAAEAAGDAPKKRGRPAKAKESEPDEPDDPAPDEPAPEPVPEPEPAPATSKKRK